MLSQLTAKRAHQMPLQQWNLPQYMPRIFTTNSQLTEEDHILPRRRNAKQQQLIAATARLVR